MHVLILKFIEDVISYCSTYNDYLDSICYEVLLFKDYKTSQFQESNISSMFNYTDLITNFQQETFPKNFFHKIRIIKL